MVKEWKEDPELDGGTRSKGIWKIWELKDGGKLSRTVRNERT